MWIALAATMIVALGMTAASADDGDGGDGEDKGKGKDTDTSAGDGNGGEGTDTSGDGSGDDKDKAKFTDGDMAKARRRAEADTESAKKQAADLQKERDELAEWKTEREKADMSETERLKAEADEARAETAKAQAETAKANQNALRSSLIASDGAGLPPAYRRLVAGETEEDVKASIAELTEAHTADGAVTVSQILADAATMTPEELLEAHPEAGKQLAERLKGKPVSLGGSSAAGDGASGTKPYGDQNRSPEAWAKDRVNHGLKRPIR